MSVNTWSQFVRRLEELPWQSSDEVLDPLVLEVLGEVAGRNDVWQARLAELLRNESEFRALEPFHSFPRLLMDKFVIHTDATDRFRVRLHRFNAQENTNGAKERIHSHKWPGYTLLLRGELQEELFAIHEFDESSGYASISIAERKFLKTGDVDAKRIGVPHRVTNLSENRAAYTLFVRGPSRNESGLIFDEKSSRCWPWLGSTAALRKGFEIFGELSDEFI